MIIVAILIVVLIIMITVEIIAIITLQNMQAGCGERLQACGDKRQSADCTSLKAMSDTPEWRFSQTRDTFSVCFDVIFGII